MKVLICGDRNWYDSEKIAERISKLPSDAIVIHGACRGADRIAGSSATAAGLEVRAYPADWKRYGRGAGPIRNQQMLEEKPDLVIAFHSNLAESKGTANMINRASAAGVKVEMIV